MKDINNMGFTNTDLKIKELVNKASSSTLRDSNQFMIDVQKTISDGIYTTNDEAIKGVLEYADSKGVTYKGVDSLKILGDLNNTDTSFLNKTVDSAKAGLNRIQTAGEGIASGELNIDEGLARGVAGTLQTFFSPIAGLVGEGIEAIPDDIKQSIKETASPTIGGIIDWYAGQSPEQQKRLNNIGVGVEIIAEFVGVKGAGMFGQKIIKEGAKGVDVLKGTTGDIVAKTKGAFTKKEGDLLSKLDLDTQKGSIGGIEVEIPKQKKTLTEKVVAPFVNKSEKELAGRAISPRTIGKNAKQKLKSVADIEINARKLYNNVRTGVLEGSIDTLENTAQTVVNNIDIVGARIGNAVKKVEGDIKIDNTLTDDIINALGTKGSEVSPATPILRKFFDSLGGGNLNVADAYDLKKAYSNEVTKLYKSGDAGTKQYKALSDGVNFLNTKIDQIIETKLGGEFAQDKVLFRELKTIVDDLVASSLVEGRRSPNTLAEQIGMVESIFSPVSSVKQKLIKTVGEANTRGGAWKTLIKKYDEQAVQGFQKIKDTVKVTAQIKIKKAIETMPINTLTEVNNATSRIIQGLGLVSTEAQKAGQIVREFIMKHGEDFKNRLGELLDNLADKIPGVKNKFIDDSGKSLDDFNKVGTTKNANITQNELIPDLDFMLK